MIGVSFGISGAQGIYGHHWPEPVALDGAAVNEMKP